MKTIPPFLARKAGLVMMATISILLAGVLLLVCVLLAWSYPGKPQPFLDANGKPLAGSVSEKIRVDINGLQQGMFIEGKNIDNPVLLFIHGGPGMPEYWPTQDHSTGGGRIMIKSIRPRLAVPPGQSGVFFVVNLD